METLLKKADIDIIKEAAILMKKGEIVAIPTETVYGIAANSFDGAAIEKIFKAKGRPQDNPLIVHISNMEMLNDVVSKVSNDAKKLMAAFWPGPLTIIMQKGDKVSFKTTAMLDSVGVRMPSNWIAHRLIEECGFPFSAPSANLSGRPSPTNASDVYEDMKGRLPLILDGGESVAGVESTVVSMLGKKPIILRPGVITKSQLEKVLGKEVLISEAITKPVKEGEKVLSPGMKYKHYAPKAEIMVIDSNFEKYRQYVLTHKKEGVYCLCFEDEEKLLSADIPCINYGKASDSADQAHNLFSSLRKLDKVGAKIVYARCPKKEGISLAVYNRLIRAAAFREIKL